MKDKHIIYLLENGPFAELTETDHRLIREHVAECAACAWAYEVAGVSSSLLKDGAPKTIEPSPFFETRVLAAIREQQNEPGGLAKVWRAAGALVSSMTAAVALLAVLSFAAPDTQTTAEVSSANGYTAEEVILDQTENAQGQASDAELLSTLYPADEEER